MKRIVLCFDGTWSTPGDPNVAVDLRVETNVSRFAESVAGAGEDGVRQVVWYNKGVGTDWFDHLAGGAFGAGIDEHILSGYRYLVDTYQDGDAVYVLGFSRGAYEARSLVGLLRKCGLVKPSFVNWEIHAAYGIYRMRDEGPDTSTAVAFRKAFSREIRVAFVGVWDTVGSLGIPLHFADRLNLDLYGFHDLRLSNIVDSAYQAIALDEHRKDFDITLWVPTEAPSIPTEQRWFVGSHSNVGGGEDDRRLSDLTLRWMQERAALAGLRVTPVSLGDANWLGPIDDSYHTFLNGLYADTGPPINRAVFTTRFGNEAVDPTIDLRRAADPAYRPANPGLPAPAAVSPSLT